MQVPQPPAAAENNSFYVIANITSSSPYYLWCQSEGFAAEDTELSEIWVDGIKQSGIPSSYTFSSTGQHIIKYVPSDGKNIKYNLLDFGSSNEYNYLPINTIVIGEGIETIDDYSFGCISNLSGLFLPSSLTEFIGQSFCKNSSLTSVTFNGTKSQWNSITKEPGWCIYSPITVVHCTDGDINL